jgi:hypothetical protein
VTFGTQVGVTTGTGEVATTTSVDRADPDGTAITTADPDGTAITTADPDGTAITTADPDGTAITTVDPVASVDPVTMAEAAAVTAKNCQRR